MLLSEMPVICIGNQILKMLNKHIQQQYVKLQTTSAAVQSSLSFMNVLHFVLHI